MDDFIVFLGAGASAPFDIPTMTGLVEGFEKSLKSKLTPVVNLYNEIKNKLQSYRDFDIEALITVLQDIIDVGRVPDKVFNKPSIHYFSSWGTSYSQMLENFKKHAISNLDNAKTLLADVKNYIADMCCIKNQQPFDLYDIFFHQILFKTGINYIDDIKKKVPKNIQCYIFTTNYDKVIEAYCRRREIIYDCGELQNGIVDIRTNSRLISNESIFHIFKLHGSTYWYVDDENNMRWLTQPAQVGSTTYLGDRIIKELAIYPAQEKYTFREPFYNMFRYLKERLCACSDCYVVGYSFRDDDILGLFSDALDLNRRLSLYLIDPKAENIIKERFSDYSGRIKVVQSDLSTQAIKNLS